MLKAGVLGAGHLGKIHLRLLQESPRYTLQGFYDVDEQAGRRVSEEFGYTYYSDLDELIAAVDVVDVVTPTLSHYEAGKKAISAGKHLFIEKPVTNTVEEAQQLVELARLQGVKGQVGHVERFNPAFVAAADRIDKLMFPWCST